MPIALTPFDHRELCHGCTWTVQDEDLLARHIAAVALGQSRHVERVIAGAGLGLPPPPTSAADAAITMLTVPAGATPYHRDGWMFQVMSWIAAHRNNQNGLIRPPQMILAHKGFDGLQLEIDTAAQTVTAAIIFEDKATENARDTVRDEVWPAVVSLEGGGQDNVLTAEVIALLQTRPGLDPDRAIENVLWKQVKRYRVSVTVGDAHADEAGRRRLFNGYEGVATGACERRRGETLLIPDLRPWMAQLAVRAVDAVRAMVAVNV